MIINRDVIIRTILKYKNDFFGFIDYINHHGEALEFPETHYIRFYNTRVMASADEAEKNIQDIIDHLINNNGTHSVDHFHKRLGKIMWNKCGMARNAQGLKEAAVEIAELREEFWKDVRVPGTQFEYNEELAKATRVADYLELGELFAKDALHREESAGGHFREEHQTEEGEALRRPEFQFVSAWEYTGDPKEAILHKEDLVYENIEVKERSYK